MKRIFPKSLCFFLATVMVFMQIPLGISAASTSSEAVQVIKTVNPLEILEGEEAEIKLDVKGSGDVNFIKPNDVILIIDRSGSMTTGEDKMTNAKNAAKGFIDLVDFSKHRIGVVDFSSDSNYKDLSSDPNDLKNYINKIQAGGGTDTEGAIKKARDLLGNHRTDAQPVILLLTDGEANDRQKALDEARLAKSEGIVFYTIALLKSNEDPNSSAPNQLMKEMATTAHHHHFVLGSVGLAEIYKAIVDEIGVASAYDVTVTDTIGAEFEIVPNSYTHNIPQPVVNGNTVIFKFNELKEENLSLTYKIRHKVGAKIGDLSVGGQNIDVTYKDFAGTTRQFDVQHPVIKVSYPAPVITSIVEDNGTIQGGETVIINGSHFRDNPAVTFGNVPATSIQFVDSNKLIVVAPAGVQGTVDVKVSNTDGQSATSPYRYYATPEFTGISPKEGPLGGGNDVVISGQYFMQDVQVKFGGVDSVVKSSSPKQIIVTVPAAAAPGVVDISIINPDRTEVTAQNAYEYLQGPVIVEINPASGLISGGEEVIIRGEHFRTGAQVKFNTVSMDVEFISSSELKILTPSWTKAESVNVTVINPDGQTATFDKGYTYEYPAPIIENVTPNEGLVTGGDLVVIEGKNFFSGSKVMFKDVEIATSYLDSTHLRVRSPQWTSEEKVDIFVKNPDGKIAKMDQAYTYKLPPVFEFTSVSPSSGPLAGGNMVYLNGAHFNSNLFVYVGDTNIAYSLISSSQISLRIPKATIAGKVDIKIADKYQREVILREAYEYLAPPPLPEPKVVSVSPNETLRTAGELLIITGENFQEGATVWFNDIKVNSTLLNAQQLRLRAPIWNKEEIVDVKVVNPDGQSGSLAQSLHFTNPAPDPSPEISSLSPSSGELTGDFLVLINGNYFKNGAKVYFGTKEVATSFLSNTQLRVRAPLWNAAETVKLKVVNPDGLEGETDFIYTLPAPGPAPEITEISPNPSVYTGGSLAYINGKNFNAQSVVKFGDKTIVASLMSDQQLRVRIPAWPQPEVITVSVTNADGQMAESTFEYTLPPPPSITSLAPNHMQLDLAGLVTINGQNFQSGAKVMFGDKVFAASFLSDTQLRVRAPIWPSAETVSISVVNPDGQIVTLDSGFTFDPKPMKPAPVITSVSPNSAPKASNIIVYINGENFIDGAKVSLDSGTPIAASFLSSKQLRFRLPISTKTGPVNVTVINPDGQSVTLDLGFTYE